jgi:Tol biopolymer transport system component
MSGIDWVPELAASLDRVVPLEDSSHADWDDVVGRVGRRHRLKQRRGDLRWSLRLAIVVALVFLLLAGVATATYLLVRGPVGVLLPRGPNAFPVLDATGHLRWIPRSCPRDQFCGEVVGAALSPGGAKLATSTFEIGATSTYPGLHITDLKTGVDWRIPSVRRYELGSIHSLVKLGRDDVRTLGCAVPSYLSWSPSGSRLAYSCLYGRPRIYTIRSDGIGRRLLRTDNLRAVAPTWSPDGKRIAFSSGTIPRRGLGSHVYVVDADGRHLRRLAAGALPDWSPDGKTIAYVTLGCNRAARWGGRIRLVTPGGRDVTPARRSCLGIGPADSSIESWSPDGARIAVVAGRGLYVMNADGGRLQRVKRRYSPASTFPPFWIGASQIQAGPCCSTSWRRERPFSGLIRPVWLPPHKRERR